MCGFLGEVTSRPRGTRDWPLEPALRALRHRGPDGEGVFEDESRGVRCRLVHTRLAIIDPRQVAAQPMHDARRGNTLAFNGEIYNYRELRRDLEATGEEFTTDSDTEVLLRAFGVWGHDSVSRLRGMFAFALWERASGRLTLARDRLGIKPLYARESSAGAQETSLLFGSEVRAMLAAGAGRTLSEPALESFLAFGAVWSRSSMVAGIEELDPATLLTFEDGKASRERYWRLRSDSVAAAVPTTAAAASVAPVLREAVALQLRSDVPLGVFLSAGMDSAALAALARASSATAPITLTVNFAGPGAEGREAAEIARALGTDHRQIDISLEEAAAWVPQAVAAMDQPSVDGVNTWIVSRAAREAGLKVCLSGLGGDEVFAGYSSFKQFAEILSASRTAWPVAAVARSLLAHIPFSISRLDVQLRKAAWLLSTRGNAADSYAALRALYAPEQAQALWPRFDVQAAHRRNVRGEGLPPNDPVNELALLEISNYMRGTLLRDTDSMSMSHGLEVRPPLLDERLVEALLALPGACKISSGINKPLLWGCVENLLPSQLPRRRKTGFGLPFDAWLDGPLRAWHREGLEAARDLGLSAGGERRLGGARSRGAVAWHRWFAPAVLGHWAARNGVTR
jgi:asparagine synthase (glutamine-hydrolysing)